VECLCLRNNSGRSSLPRQHIASFRRCRLVNVPVSRNHETRRSSIPGFSDRMSSLTAPVATHFSAEELAAFDRDGFLVARNLADESLRQRMLAAIRDGIERQIEPIEYEADLQYPGAPPDRDAQGGRTPRRLL